MNIFKKILSLSLCLILLLSLQTPFFADEQNDGGAVILHPEELAAYLEGKSEDDIVPLWIFFKLMSNAEKDALLSGIEISPDQSDLDYYHEVLQARRKLIYDYYDGMMKAFQDQYLDGCRILLFSRFAATFVAEVPISRIDAILASEAVESIGLYVEEDAIQVPHDGGNLPAEVLMEDVAATDYYCAAVTWAINTRPAITKGTGERTFSPQKACTRAEAVTFLWRACGCPKPLSEETIFTDISRDAYYYNAVLWANERGVTQGTSETLFSPSRTCTRAQIVTFLWRLSGEERSKSGAFVFADVQQTAYYADAVAWAVENGITKGVSETAFAPNQTCTRAQIVTFLYRQFHGE